MTKMQHPDINDDQIRFISSNADKPAKKKKYSRFIYLAAVCAILLLLVPIVTFRVFFSTEEITVAESDALPEPVNTLSDDANTLPPVKSYTTVKDSVINKVKLTILTPVGGKPELAIGSDAIGDSTVSLIVQAADIRSDNGKIVGAFVSKGKLISSGQSKAGFCAIISGKITIGVADATPYLEQALDTEGDFFRQYPLVVGNQVVENKPKGVSLRKAIAELNGKMRGIISRDKLTFHDFSQALVDLGVTNAIYLVGSNAYGFARAEDGSVISFGTKNDNLPQNTSYLI